VCRQWLVILALLCPLDPAENYWLSYSQHCTFGFPFLSTAFCFIFCSFAGAEWIANGKRMKASVDWHASICWGFGRGSGWSGGKDIETRRQKRREGKGERTWTWTWTWPMTTSMSAHSKRSALPFYSLLRLILACSNTKSSFYANFWIPLNEI